jgi:hypothetical protein
MKKDDKKDEENKSLDRVSLKEDFLQKFKITTNIPLKYMNLHDHERCPVRFISSMLKAKGNYQWSNDAFEDAIHLYPQYARSMH